MISDDHVARIIIDWTTDTGDVDLWPMIRVVEREARREALEEAARVCDGLHDARDPGQIGTFEQYDAKGYRSGCWGCAAAIRALADWEKP